MNVFSGCKEPSADGNTFAGGVRSMARNTKAAVILLRSSRWTLDQLDEWLDLIIEQDLHLNRLITTEDIVRKFFPDDAQKGEALDGK